MWNRKSNNRRQIVESLRTIALFADCSDAELVRIDGLLSEIRVAPGRKLMGHGAAALQFMIVRDGYGSVSAGDQDIGRVGPGSHVGERTFQGEAWNATITAMTPMDVLVLNAAEFATLLAEVPSVKAKLEPESVAPKSTPAPVTHFDLAQA